MMEAEVWSLAATSLNYRTDSEEVRRELSVARERLTHFAQSLRTPRDGLGLVKALGVPLTGANLATAFVAILSAISTAAFRIFSSSSYA